MGAESNKFEKIGRVSSASVQKHTKKSWEQWVSLLNAAGAANWTYQETVAFLKKKYKLTPWWLHGVTYGYEIALGRRVDGQNKKGEYAVTVTKTLPVSDKVLWKFLASSEGLAIWLQPLSKFELKPKNTFETEDGFFGEVRTMLAGRRARLKWQESDEDAAMIVQLHLIPRSGNKCILAFYHEKLKNGRLKNQARERWQSIADKIAQAVKN